MHRLTPIGRWTRGIAAVGLLLTSTVATAGGQATKATAGPRLAPALPGAVSRPPEWLPPGAPFDVAAFLAVPPEAENAAPLYLDALLEFSGDTASCFPDDATTRRRAEVGKARAKRASDLYQAMIGRTPQQTGLPPGVEALVAEHAEGLQKIREAQKRPRCVFATALGGFAMLPHAQGARRLVTVYALKTALDLNRRKPDDAIDNLASCLRMARDLRPRGVAITQFVATAIEGICFREILPKILATPGLSAERCSKVLKILADHEAKSGDPYNEALKAESLAALVTLHECTTESDRMRKELGLKPDAPISEMLIALVGEPLDPASKLAIDARLKAWKPADEAKATEAVYRSLQAQLDPASQSYAARIRAGKDPMSGLLTDEPSLRLLLANLQISGTQVASALARGTADLRGARCVAGLRQSLMTKGVVPDGIAALAKAAGIDPVPLDPFDGKPLRMVKLGKKNATIYSIGKDLKDDGGQVDSEHDTKPGDLIYRGITPGPG